MYIDPKRTEKETLNTREEDLELFFKESIESNIDGAEVTEIKRNIIKDNKNIHPTFHITNIIRNGAESLNERQKKLIKGL